MAEEKRQRRPRLTRARLMVLREFLVDPAQELAGTQLCERTGLPEGTVYPMLIRLREHGWLKSRWEGAPHKQKGYPARRFYRLTEEGLAGARWALGARWGRHEGRPLQVGLTG